MTSRGVVTTQEKSRVVVGSPAAVMALDLFLVEKFQLTRSIRTAPFFSHKTPTPPSAPLRGTPTYQTTSSSAPLLILFMASVNMKNVSSSATAQQAQAAHCSAAGDRSVTHHSYYSSPVGFSAESAG